MLTGLSNLSGIITGALLGLLLALPWLLRVAHYSPLSSGIESNLSTIVNGSSTAAYIWKLLGPASNYALPHSFHNWISSGAHKEDPNRIQHLESDPGDFRIALDLQPAPLPS